MISKDKFLSDFKNTLEQVESLLQEGAQIDGRYRGKWTNGRIITPLKA
jgi:hypothetical protein